MSRTCLVVAAFLALHLLAASGRFASAWGFDSLAYQGPSRRWAFAVAAAMLFVPAVRGVLLGFLERVPGLRPERDARRDAGAALMLAAVLAAGGGILFAMLPSAVHLLGDGLFHINSLKLMESRGLSYADTGWANNNAPLSYWVLETIHRLGKPWWKSAVTSMRVLSILAGVAYFALAVPVSRRLAGTAAARGLILGFLATAGATQLFAGYAEIYGLLLPPLFLYVLAALRDLPSSRFPWLPACVLGVLVALHVMSVTLLPSLVLLALVRSEDGRLRFRFGTRVAAAASSLAAVLLMAAVASAIFFALDFDLLEYVRTRREGHLLPLFSEPTFVQSYRMFSFRHLFDVANQYVLAAPAAVMGAFLLRGNGWFHAQRVLLAVAAVPVVIFTIVANPEVGAFRDWDVFSFAAPLVLLWVGASLGRSLRDAPQIGHVALLLIGAAGFHSLSWIAVNADAAAAEARFTRLLQSCPISRHAKAYGWETFSIHSKVTARPEESLSAFDRAIKADPDNPRYWQMAGELCLEMNRDDRARWYLTRALELRPGFVDARFALGIAYFRADEIAEAEALFQHVVAQDPNRADAWYRLGLCHSRRENREEALRCFRAAVEAKPDFADAQIELASLLRTRGEIGAARSAFARFLEVEPEGARAKEVRRLLAEELRETSAQKPRSP